VVKYNVYNDRDRHYDNVDTLNNKYINNDYNKNFSSIIVAIMQYLCVDFIMCATRWKACKKTLRRKLWALLNTAVLSWISKISILYDSTMSVYALMMKNLTMFILINLSNIEQLSKFMYRRSGLQR